MLRLYESPLSGNSYKVRLLLAHLGTDYQRVTLDLFKGEARSPDFLAKNPNGRVPVLELAPGRHIPESNAILCYLARDTPYLPADPLVHAQVLSWMFFEQNSLEPYLAGARFLLRFAGKSADDESVAKRQERAERALMLMELHLGVRSYFAGNHYSVADICLYAYTHLADQAEIPLDGYPSIQDWLARVESQPGYIPMADDTSE